MDQTFPLRRWEIVEEGPPVKTLKERWPALFTERQVFAEFNRIATTNLQNNFFDAMDHYTPRFVTIFKSKKGTVGETLAEFVQQIDLRDADRDEACAQASAGVLTVISEDVPLCPNHLHLDAVSTAIIVEGGLHLRKNRGSAFHRHTVWSSEEEFSPVLVRIKTGLNREETQAAGPALISSRSSSFLSLIISPC
ncbi:hypothetical protein MHYP_G00017210 [Metynnis hypsauchen]